METKKSLVTIVEKMELLQENEQGQLKGGFASVVSLALGENAFHPTNDKCKNKRCTIINVADLLKNESGYDYIIIPTFFTMIYCNISYKTIKNII